MDRLWLLIRELRRRHVFRVAGIYIVAAWVVLQVADMAFPGMDVPDTAIRYVWLAVFMGFPLALVFGYRYDITAQGIVRTPPTDADTQIDISLHRTDHVILSLLAAIAVGVIYQLTVQISSSRSDQPVLFTQNTVNPNSIAVLPFGNVSRQASQQIFVDGMHDTLISVLSGISALKVISRTSARRYVDTDKSLIEIGRELGAANIIEGSVLRDGSDVRITVQLIDAASDQLKWSSVYDHQLVNILRLQSELAKAIAAEVEVVLTPGESAYLDSTEQIVPEAYDEYLKGRFHWYQFTPQDLDIALNYFESAIGIDPGYALAYVGYADALSTRGHIGLVPATEVFPRAIELVDKALELDPLLAEAHDLSARIKFAWDFDWLGADRGFRESIRLKPSHADARIVYSQFLGVQERWEESMRQVRAGLTVDPFNKWFRVELGVRLSWTGRYDEALEEYLAIAEDHPNWFMIYRKLWEVHFFRGEPEQALAAAKTFYKLSGAPRLAEIIAGFDGRSDFPAAMQALATEMLANTGDSHVSAVEVARIFAFAGDVGKTLDWLEQAHADRDSGLVYSAANPLFGLVWEHPRYAGLRRKMNLPAQGSDH